MATGLMTEYQEYIGKLKNAIDDTLVIDVAEEVVEHLKSSAQDRVYEAYEPSQYERRESLLKNENYERSSGNLELEISSLLEGNADQPPFDSGNITDVIETGVGYGWLNSTIARQMLPRPFMEEGLQDSVRDGSAESALQQGLESRGF